MLNIKLETNNTEKMIKTNSINFFKSEIGAAKAFKNREKKLLITCII